MTTESNRNWTATALLVSALLAPRALAHDPRAEPGPHAHASARAWHDARTGEAFQGALLAVGTRAATIELDAGGVVSIALDDLAADDRAAALAAQDDARTKNGAPKDSGTSSAPAPWQAEPFAMFAPSVHVRWDARWLYVESDGLPHAPFEFTMMKGIRAWQQQVPLPQPYVGDNAWQIPLAPELADQPVSARTYLRRGAIALAANGIPIFNALNNRGEDAFAIGELDEFGGHCGRADDYHYHVAPLALSKVLGPSRPIAFALDGFPIYGLFDPAAKPGSERACPAGSTAPLDALNGHECTVPAGRGLAGGTRSYHYHASTTYPYVNGGLRGKVTVEDDQIVPQPRAQSVREAGTPLRGARITGFTAKSPTSWALVYEVDGKTYRIEYALEGATSVRFDFIGPDGARRTETYERRAQREGRERRGPNGDPPRRDGGRGERPSNDEPRSSAPATKDATAFALRSSALDASGKLDAKYTCDGDGVSPPFEWSNLPAGTQSLALTVHHVPPEGGEHVYLVLWDLAPTTKALAAAQRELGTFGVNTVNRRAEWAPPCSQGPGEKLYVATLFALSAKPALPANAGAATRAELLDAMKTITLGTATLELRYARPDNASERARGGQEREGRNGRESGGAPRAGGEGGGRREGEGRGARGGRDGDGREPRDGRGNDRKRQENGDADTFHVDVPAHELDVVLAEPTDTSIRVSVRTAKACEARVEYRLVDANGAGAKRASGDRSAPTRTNATKLDALRATAIDLTGLAPDAEYRYRVLTRVDGEDERASDERAFRTRRAPGSAFTFTITADSHLDSNVSPDVFVRTLENALADHPDLHVDLGDTFMTDKRRDFRTAAPQYDAQRWFLGKLGASAPLFLVLGNHDGEAGYAPEIDAWSYAMRTERFPAPRIGDVYSGKTAPGSNWYAFTWGDALFVVLDPFGPTTERVRGVDAKEGFTDGAWVRTLGREQYDWLATTLATTKAKHKLVFIHHLVGGRGREARGGAESAPYFEWGGKNADGSDGFAAHRAGWPMPIHALLVKHGVEVVFHGHDHLFVRSELDGVVYQCVPQPGNALGGTRSAEEYGYASGTILGSPGYLRVRVTPNDATVEFVRSALETSARREREANGAVVHAYTVTPRVATTSGR